MSQTLVWAANLGTTVRRNRNNGDTSGQGQAKRWYVGRHGSYDYDAYVRFALSWSGVGRIVSATLSLYTDDGLGDMPSTTSEHPRVIIRRLMDSFAEGNAPDGEWQANDYTVAAGTTSDQRAVNLSRAEGQLNTIDVTAIVEDWAPSTVKRRNGKPGGKASNHGFGIFGTSETDQNIGLFSDKASDPASRPILTLVYEYGPTVPDAPTNVLPSGTVAALVDFQGDFTDSQRPTDTLKSSTVQVYDAGHSGTAEADDNLITDAGHGLIVNDRIYFTSLTGGVGLSTFTAYYVKTRPSSSTFTVATSIGGATVNITDDYSALTWSKLLYSATKVASRTEIDADRFTHVPDNLSFLKANTTYRWRSRVTDQEGQVSPFTSLVSFNFQNTAPSAPVLTPVTASSFVNPDGIVFRGTFVDVDPNDTLTAYQVQMSAYPEGDTHWDDDEFILWNTGKRYITPSAGPFETPYGGGDLEAGTYYWRARVYDSKSAASDWEYASITFSQDFESDPETPTTAIQLRPRAPWRIVIKAMGALRGPGAIVAIIEDAKNVGASELYNSPGEAHWTLGVDHPQLSALEPKQTHYSIQFRQGDGWHEVFAGLVDDFDATDTDIIFYGVDYLGLLDRVVDERYDPSNPDKPVEKGGSKYVSTGKNSIGYIVDDQLDQAKALPNSPVGFISVGSIATMTETLVVYSTYAPTLQFIVGLLDSHRAGTGKRTRLRCRRTNTGTYEWIVQDNPGQVRDNLRMRYGELVQGYRVVAFGSDWATRISGIGRAKDGLKVMYETRTGAGIDEAVWGRFSQVRLFDGISDANDLRRRIKQAAAAAAKLGKQIGLGLRSGVLQPKDGYEVCDVFPIDIEHGSVSTDAFGSGYWAVVGVTWTTKAQDGKQDTILTFQPREDTVAPDTDLLILQPISPQAEWQVGWEPPTPFQFRQVKLSMDTGLLMDDGWTMDSFAPLETGRYWLDITTGIIYELSGDGETWQPRQAPPTPAAPTSLDLTSRVTINEAGISVVNVSVEVTP